MSTNDDTYILKHKQKDKLEALRKLRTSISQIVGFVESERSRLNEVGLNECLVDGPVKELEALLEMVEDRIRKTPRGES